MIRFGEDFCLACGESFQSCECEKMIGKERKKIITPPRYDEVYFKAIEVMDREDNLLVNPPAPVFRHTSAADEQAYATLYDALQEARNIVHRGLRDGQKGYKRALQQAARVLEGVT